MVNEYKNDRFKVGMVCKVTHDLGAMLTYLGTRIFDTFGWSQDVLHKFDYVLCSVHMHKQGINYAGTFISTGWIFLYVDGITNSSNIMEDLAMHQLVGLLPYKYILLPMQIVMVMC